jgi:hypothetical protein
MVAGLLFLGAAAALPLAAQEAGAAAQQPASWDSLRAARAKAEEFDNAGKFAEALQYHLEYASIAERLGWPELVAWGKNNAAYMIVKMHRQDPTVDLAPARKMLEDGLAIPEATENCRKALARNLEFVKSLLKSLS